MMPDGLNRPLWDLVKALGNTHYVTSRIVMDALDRAETQDEFVQQACGGLDSLLRQCLVLKNELEGRATGSKERYCVCNGGSDPVRSQYSEEADAYVCLDCGGFV